MENVTDTNAIWMWAAVGAVLLAGELITTSFVLVFFAVAAFVTAILVWMHPLHTNIQIIVFAAVGLLSLAIGRRWVLARWAAKAPPAFAVDPNSEFKIDRELAPGAEGAVTYQGAPWTAVNDGQEMIRNGEKVRVVKTSGIKLVIRKAGE